MTDESSKLSGVTIKPLETTAPCDIAFAGLGLAVGAAVGVHYFLLPGDMTIDSVATFSSSGAVGLLYAYRAIRNWQTEQRDAQKEKQAEAAKQARHAGSPRRATTPHAGPRRNAPPSFHLSRALSLREAWGAASRHNGAQ